MRLSLSTRHIYYCLEVDSIQIWILNFKNSCSFGCFERLEFVPSMDFMEKEEEEDIKRFMEFHAVMFIVFGVDKSHTAEEILS